MKATSVVQEHEVGGAVGAPDPDALVAVMLAEEQRRRAQQESSTADEALESVPIPATMGEGEPMVPFREIVTRGRYLPLALLCAMPFLDSILTSVFGVLAPDIAKSLHTSTYAVATIGGLGGITVLLSSIPFGRLADKYARWPLVGWATIAVAASTFWSGLAGGMATLVMATLVSGLLKGKDGPVEGSLIADSFPVAGRNRVFGVTRSAGNVGLVLGPLIAGGIASLAGGPNGWRWPFFVIAVPTLVIGVVCLRQKEPRRGGQEMAALFGADDDVIEREDAVVPPKEEQASLGGAWNRLQQVKTFNYLLVAVTGVGFAVFGVGIFGSLYIQSHFGLGAAARGVIASVTSVGMLVGSTVGAPLGERWFRRSPSWSVRFTGVLILIAGLIYAAAFLMPNAILYTVLAGIGGSASMTASVILSTALANAMPYRVRATGLAIVGIFSTLVGALGGNITVNILKAVMGQQAALVVALGVSGVVAGLWLLRGSRFVEHDLAAAAADLLDEHEQAMRAAKGLTPPLLQVQRLDYSYGSVQVLFDVNLEIREGEVLALLGTNGAGKSTVLRAITGLGAPDRGTIRMGGTVMAASNPVSRLRHGIVLVPGGKATFPTLTVRENLRIKGSTVRKRGLAARIDKVLETFPILAERLDQPAGTLSGGEQQMLAIAGSMLLEPRLLLIDELSLGLAPVVVQQLLEVIGELKAKGQTILIVEQSLNVALSVADRAIFMEKGQVRFEGSAEELLSRDDLARAVFLGGEGG